MSPSLLDGDEVLVAPARGVRAGEVVVVKAGPGCLVLHRVVEVAESGIVTRGDACQGSDPPAPARAVLLKALLRRRQGRVAPIPSPGWRAALRRLRFRLRRLLGRPLAAPGRSWRERP